MTKRKLCDCKFDCVRSDDSLVVCRLQGVTPSAESTPAHTDHPLRHFDRTCPACVASSTEAVASSETPRTDAAKFDPAPGTHGHEWVYAEEARQLERELAEAKKMHAEAIEQWSHWEGEAKRLSSSTARSEIKVAEAAIDLYIEYFYKYGYNQGNAKASALNEFADAEHFAPSATGGKSE